MSENKKLIRQNMQNNKLYKMVIFIFSENNKRKSNCF